jgi:hypothetical protein
MVKTGFCQGQFRQTNEHQRYLNKKLHQGVVRMERKTGLKTDNF